MKSLWMNDDQADHSGSVLRGSIETDTAIVGGGLAGVLCATMLRERGIPSIVVEAKRIGMGVTGNTTAKVTAQHGLIYQQVAKQYGLGAAKAYLAANQEAVESYRRLAQNLPCDFEEKTAYVYSRDNRQKLREEANIYRQIGVAPIVQEKPPLPIQTVGALGMERQAQFHPLKFLRAIAEGLEIYENTFAREIKPGKILTDRGSISARRIILATHYPMVNVRGLYFMKLYQHRSYVLALTGAKDPGGMYIDEQEGGLSFRTYKDYLLLGGGGHQTGKKGGGWDTLRQVARTAYPGAQEEYAWATQDCMTLDAIPYIGRHRKNNRELYVTTGFNKWGMTGSMAAAKLLSDLIAEGSSRYEALFSPSRSMLHPQLFLNMGQAAAGLLTFGKKCPHMGCTLKWNSMEHTWDCPCHGSRFDKAGNLIDNPAKRGLHIE
ncbi:FAD-dependent oxidoreductase [Oscillospiraceae bacterium MB08-C2-2]|nr:FAD-dependent oxidoreductase [Oscillospiraceae bacterium MB08-C2-2]